MFEKFIMFCEERNFLKYIVKERGGHPTFFWDVATGLGGEERAGDGAFFYTKNILFI